MKEGVLLNNSCGHCFCGDCWTAHALTQQMARRLFPLCPQEGCYHFANYRLLQALWAHNPLL
jgi:hypothetical protein